MFYTPIELSKNQQKTPEGFLVCYGCAIARTGFQLYNEMEVPRVPAGPDGMIKVERSEKEVFSPRTIASAEGKDIVIDHPSEDVVPANWQELAKGHMQNVRRGEGVEDHLLLADLVFKHPHAIAMIEANPHTQLSLGYDARYEIIGVGHAEQCDIVINHCAMVEAARCGPTCATRDRAPARTLDLWGQTEPEKTCTLSACRSQENCGCAETQRTGDAMAGWIDRIKDAFKAKDEKAFGEAVRDAEQHLSEQTHDEHHVHIHIGGEGPKTTKPEGGLPETGEERVTSAADAHQVGGEQAATFGGHAFFADSATNELFHGEMKKMGDSIIGCHGEMAKIKGAMDSMSAKMDEHFKAKTDDKVAGEESAHEKAAREIEGELKMEAPPGTSDAHKSRDSAFLGDSFKKTCEDAECLVPGIGLPTFDAAAVPVDGYKVICGIRRKALMAFGATAEGEKALGEVTQVRDLAGCSCRDVTGAFRAAVAMQKARNSDMKIRGFRDGEKQGDDVVAAKPVTMADVQRLNEEYWAAQSRAAE